MKARARFCEHLTGTLKTCSKHARPHKTRRIAWEVHFTHSSIRISLKAARVLHLTLLSRTMSTHTVLASRSTHTGTRQHASSNHSQRLSAHANAGAALCFQRGRPFTAAPAGRQSALICRAEQSATGAAYFPYPPPEPEAIFSALIPRFRRLLHTIPGSELLS